MHCYHCSAVADTGAAFCERCGAQLGFTEAIIRSAMDKEENAIAFLYHETYQSVFQAIRPLIADEGTALYILQDTYIKAFESLAQLEKPEQFRAWARRIAQNKSKDWLKRKKPTLFSELHPDDEDGEIDFLDERAFAQPDVTLDKEETRRLLWDIIDSLSDEQRLVVSMYYFQEMQVKEIARELALSENTVKSSLNYARKNIESKVLHLEKQGTKLYSLAPLPFLLWLIRSAAEMPSAAALAEITSALGASGGAAASSAGTASASGAAAGTTGTTAGVSIATKIVAGIVALTIAIGGGALLYRALNSDKEPAEVVSGLEEAQDAADAATEPELDLDAQNAARTAVYVDYVESVAVDRLYHYAYSYILYDVDGDGLNELLANAHSAGDVTIESHVFAVDENGALVSLFDTADGDGGGRAWMEFVHLDYQGQDYFAHSYSDGGGNGTYRLFSPEDGGLNLVHTLEQGAGSGIGAVEVMEGAMSRDAFLSAYKNMETVPDETDPVAQADYTGYSCTTSYPSSYRIDAVGEVIQLTYTVQMFEGEVAIPYTIYGTRTGDSFAMERIEMNGQDMSGAFEKFDFVFYEDKVELTVKIQGYPAEGAPSDGSYVLTK